jgi:hypothetical protein
VSRVKTLWNTRDRDGILARLQQLTPDLRPRWGRMSCAQMVVHVTDAFALYTGELAAAGKRTPLQWPVLKHACIYLLPIPRNVPTAPELVARVPGPWPEEIARLGAAVQAFGARNAQAGWPPHPIFGRMSRRGYGVLAYRHTDHHLRQFGV